MFNIVLLLIMFNLKLKIRIETDAFNRTTKTIFS